MFESLSARPAGRSTSAVSASLAKGDNLERSATVKDTAWNIAARLPTAVTVNV